MVLAITSLLRAQQPVLGLDALQLQRAVGIPHDLRCGAPLQRDTIESSSTLGSEYYKTGALQQWTLVQTE